MRALGPGFVFLNKVGKAALRSTAWPWTGVSTPGPSGVQWLVGPVPTLPDLVLKQAQWTGGVWPGRQVRAPCVCPAPGSSWVQPGCRACSRGLLDSPARPHDTGFVVGRLLLRSQVKLIRPRSFLGFSAGFWLLGGCGRGAVLSWKLLGSSPHTPHLWLTWPSWQGLVD